MASISEVRSIIKGSGSALPRSSVTNDELAQRVDTTDDWIVARTGIRKRYIAQGDETTSTLATEAAKNALADAGVAACDVEMIIVATATPDHSFPATATQVQDALGCNGGIAFDVAAVCSGFLYALSVADNMIRGGAAKNAIVIGAEVFSRLLDWNDRTTCVLFGDGAGAIYMERSEDHKGRGVIASKLRADGSHLGLLHTDGGPGTTGTVGQVRMRGKEVFRHAVTNLANILVEVLDEAKITPDQIDWLVPHQANARILDATAKKLAISSDRVIITVDQHGNTSAASVPLALDQGRRDGRIKENDLIVFEAMGGGLTWGASVVRM